MNSRKSFLNFKPGLRMLNAHPRLSVIGGLAMAAVIAIGAAYFELAHEVFYPNLPLDNGDRVVGIMYRFSDELYYVSLQEFVALREELRSVEEIGAYQEVDRHLIVEDGLSGPIEVARITPSAFRLTGTRPLLGRTLDPADARAGASPVVVLGYDVWQTRLGGEPDVVGRTLRLDGVRTTVVGVMPESFAFPENHSLWTPLTAGAADYEREGLGVDRTGSLVHGETPIVTVFGRLAPGYTHVEAREELTAFRSRHAADFPQTDESARLTTMPYSVAVFEPMPPEGFLPYLFFAVLMVVVCATVGALMFARAARQGEITAPSGQGASPSRMMMQLLAGVLVLAVLAAALGLGAMYLAKPWGTDLLLWALEEPRAYFWWDRGLATGTVLYAAVLVLLGILLAGVVPTLKMIRQRV